MEIIGKNDELFTLLRGGSPRILDSMIKKINIFTDNVEDLIIEIDFDHRKFEGQYLRLRFLGIKGFSFYSSDKYSFGVVESFTLLKHGNLFYLSIDPEDERSPTILENDQDFVLCSSFEGCFI